MASSSERLTIFYVATGPGYVEEARRSALSCRAVMPTSRIALFTPDDCDDGPFDEIIPFGAECRDRPFELKIAGIAAACEAAGPRAVFLDTDTYVVDGIPELGDILDRFDLAAAHAPARLRWYLKPEAQPFMTAAPASYPEFNTGVIAFRCTPAVQALFSAWAELYRQHMAAAPELFHNRHQPSFRAVAYESQLRIATLPPEYNCVFHRPTGLCGPVKILHGRGNHAAIAAHLNENRGFRAVVPEHFLDNLLVVK